MATNPILICSSQNVNGRQPESTRLLPTPLILGPFDHLGSPAISINAAWVYTTNDTTATQELIPLPRFQRALEYLLNYYPTLTGRLATCKDTGIRTIERLGAGALLLEAHCDQQISSFKDHGIQDLCIFNFPGAGNALLGPWDPSPEGVGANPLLSVQHTRFSCGSVAIGLRVSHLMCDAGGFLSLYQDLAAIYRSLRRAPSIEPTLTQRPSIVPFMASSMDNVALPVDNEVCPPGFWIKPSLPSSQEGETHGGDSPAVRIIGRKLSFSAKQILQIKAKVKAPARDMEISSFTALSAYLFQATHRARLAFALSQGRSVEDLPSASFLTSVGFDAKLGLPSRYFPNAVTTPFFEISPEDLAAMPLWELGERIHDLVRVDTADKVRELGRWIAAQPDKSAIRHGFPFSHMSFITSAWHRFPLWTATELDVAPHLASAVFVASAPVDGLVYFIESKEPGCIDAMISLDGNLWDILDQDTEFQH